VSARRVLSVALVLIVSSLVFGGLSSVVGPPRAAAAELQPFSSCEDFLSYVKAHALARVTPWGLPGSGGTVLQLAVPTFEAAGDMAGGQARAEILPPDPFSETNVQVAGVDEPDLVKTDGRRLLALAQGALFVIDLTGPEPELRGRLELDDVSVRDLLLEGDRALLLGETGDRAFSEGGLQPSVPHGYGASITALVEVDLSDPERPRAARRLLLDGRYVSARMVDGGARVVLSSFPTGLPFHSPEHESLLGQRDALRFNREVIRDSGLESWVPYFVLEREDGEVEAEGSLLDCASAHHPEEFSGFGMLTVLTLDLSAGLDGPVAERSVGILSDGETVYASAENLYVATQRWIDWEAAEGSERDRATEGHTTQIHRFDISGSDRAAYRSSGEVRGWLLNQFSMDEHDGRLRVASTDSPPFWETSSSESMVTVLEERAGRLAPVGRVAGLGKGERIFAVRFMGDLGYVVTFREVDPLYVVDLSVPARPRVAGELKIPGYSAYLHPLDDGLLLGVGQDATDEGVVKGTQVSVFDVSDPGDPRRIDHLRIGEGSSEAEWDHHAFLYWEPDGLIVLPLNVYGWSEGSGGGKDFFGAMAIRAREGTLDVAGRLAHPDAGRDGMEIRRSLVVGELLYTVSETGVEAVTLDTLEDAAWVPFR
jgi:uncharacterized secreted protein with C-terminal beta-propeller domain